MTTPENVETPRRESALGVARRLGHELPTEAQQRDRIDREFPTPTPENVECQTCNDFRQVFASRDVERPELDRWYACPDCTTPENVETRCRTCGGFRTIQADIEGVSMGVRCPECSMPENVEDHER